MGDKCNVIRSKVSGQPRQIESHSRRTLIIGGWRWVRYGRNRNNVTVTVVGHDVLRGDWRDRIHVGVVLQGQDRIGRWVNRVGGIAAGSDRV